MTDLYPLKFNPILKERLWGGNRLNKLLHGNQDFPERLGEIWGLSTVEENISVVNNGFLAGNSLEELIEVYMGDLTGEATFDMYGNEFPLLIKVIDANDDLSIQVHPSDELALEKNNSRGKTEMWYVLEAEEGATIYCGLRKGVTPEQFLEKVATIELLELLEKHVVKKGDVVFIPSGTVHSLGKGIIVAEVQQASDITYRIFDWNRVGPDGKKRELHLGQAREAISTGYSDLKPSSTPALINQTVNLINNEYFITNYLKCDKPVEKDYNLIDSFVIYYCIEGEAAIRWDNGIEGIARGETILIPAMLKEIIIEPKGTVALMEVFINNPGI